MVTLGNGIASVMYTCAGTKTVNLMEPTYDWIFRALRLTENQNKSIFLVSHAHNIEYILLRYKIN